MTKLLLATSPFVEISEITFQSAAGARKKLLEALSIEEKFSLLLRNYEEFELELLRLGLDSSLYFGRTWSETMESFYEVARRIVNLLSACRLYLDQVPHNLSGIYGSGSTQAATVKASCSREYDARLGYRVMEALRNHVQHRGLAIGILSFNDGWVEEATGTRKHRRVTTIPKLRVADLREDAEFKAHVLEELAAIGDEHDLKPFIREYLSGLGAVHAEVRRVLAPDIAVWDKQIEDLIAFYEREGDADTTALAVVARQGILYKDHVPLFAEIIKRRRLLELRTTFTGHYEKVVITNY